MSITIGHVALRARDLEKTVAFYRDTLGFPEAFRMYDDAGNPNNVHLFVGVGQFLELFPGGTVEREITGETIGPVHLCFEVDDAVKAQEEIRSRGAPIDKEAARGISRCINFWTHDPDGVRLEFAQLPPDSLQAAAIARQQK
ncbi:MAG: VOC family protein [Spirochaetaceae bacterium]|jgi:catechol 2,3-dioxygenase-like lactoylglutathione lyase family enzyme|nr:VOC family protein [Spirochaetaceae bacterium]